MAVMTLSDYVFTDLGEPVSGLAITAHNIVNNAVVLTPTIGSTTIDPATGRWTMNDIPVSGTEAVAIRIENPATGQVRYRMGNVQLQVASLTGPGGNAPIEPGDVVTAHLADNSVTDAKIGSRTANLVMPSTLTTVGTVTQLLSWIISRLTAFGIWTTADPSQTITTINSHITSRSNPHVVTASQVSAVPSTDKSIKNFRAGGTTKPSNPETNELYLDVTDSTIYYRSGTVWKPIGGGSSGDGIGFDEVKAVNSSGAQVGSTATATSTANTLTLKAGTGISVSGDSSTDTITISAASGGTSSNAFGTVTLEDANGNDLASMVADSSGDTLYLKQGTGIELSQSGPDEITISSSGGSTSIPGEVLELAAANALSSSMPSLSGGFFKVEAGSKTVGFTNGIGTLNLDATVQGFVTVLVSCRVSSGVARIIARTGTPTGGNSASVPLTVSPNSGSDSIVVDYISIYW